MAERRSRPSAWIERFAARIPAGSEVVDLACGTGRHARWLASRGHRVLAVDRDADALDALADAEEVERLQVDLERADWPLTGRVFGGVIVTNYLWRPRLRELVELVADRGVLLYETFARGNEAFGRPSSDAFLLRPGELLDAVRGELQVVAYEHGRIDDPRPAVVQRIAAVRGSAADGPIP